MKTLEQIKNDYAVTQGYGYWNELLLNNDSFTVGNLHLNKVMILAQKECLKLTDKNIGNGWQSVKELIVNENNIIK